MKTWIAIVAAAVVLALTVIGAPAQTPADIELAQKALKLRGHDPGPIDGISGPRTSAALKAYQQAQGLEATGKLDDATLGKLSEPSGLPSRGPAPTASKTQTGGDKQPSPADPAQGTKTGANVGEGASYSRSTQK
jgi:peptidoglycan hydrolase-like protein with peptidoglycan-binding domain